jgi:hypothetical protein
MASAVPGEELDRVKAMTIRLTQEHRMVEALCKTLESGLKRVANGQSTDLDVTEVLLIHFQNWAILGRIQVEI